MSEALKDLKVVELATVLAGPSVGLFFSEQGSEVIKIEHPTRGDVTRSWKLGTEDAGANVSAYFSSVNYKKIYEKADLKTEEGIQKIYDLLNDADVLLTNFKKGGDVKFGLDYATLKTKFPQLILGEINGFGEDSDRVAYDLILQAESGFMSMNGQPDSIPTKMPVALIDVLAGHQLKEGLLVTLLNRGKSGKGCKVSVSLYDSALASLVNQASNYLMADHIPQRMGSNHPNIAPYGELFKTKDGKDITFAIGSDKQFKSLCSILGNEDIAVDSRFSNNLVRVKNRVELKNEIALMTANFDSAIILNACLEKFVPAAQIKNLEEVFKADEAQDLILDEDIDGLATKRVKSVVYKITQ